MSKKGTIRKRDRMPAGRDGTKGKDAHRREKILPTHRRKGVKSKPVGTRSGYK